MVTVLAAVLLIGFTAAAVQAEGKRGKSQRMTGGGPALRFMGSSRFSLLLGLAGNRQVQEELAISDDQKAAIQKLWEAAQRVEGKRRFGPPRTDAEREKVQREVQERDEKHREDLSKILSPAQMERFDEIRLQAEGIGTVLDPDVASKLNLTDDQKSKIQTIWFEWADKTRKASAGSQTDVQGRSKQLSEFGKEAETKMMAILTDAQRKQWEDMTGQPQRGVPGDPFAPVPTDPSAGRRRGGGGKP
jgi:hypothetical protein